MVNVECNECPIRNFCEQLETAIYDKKTIDGKVEYDYCPLYQLSVNLKHLTKE